MELAHHTWPPWLLKKKKVQQRRGGGFENRAQSSPEAPPFLSRHQGLRGRNGKSKERSSMISLSEGYNCKHWDHIRTFGVSCELCRWVSFRAKRHTAALCSAFGCLLRGKDLPGTSVCMDYKYVLVSRLNDLLVINQYRSDDPSVLQWLKHCGNSTLKTSFFKRTLLMTIVKSFTFGK